MKNKFLLFVLLVLMAFALPACGKVDEESTPEETTPAEKINSFGSTANSIFLFKNFAVQDIMLADFDTSKYDVDEFGGFLKEDLKVYNDAHDFKPQTIEKDEEGKEIEPPVRLSQPIELMKLTASDNVLNQQLLYATTEDFLAYNDEELDKRGGKELSAGWLKDKTELLKKAFVDPQGAGLDLAPLLTDPETGEAVEGADEYYFLICNFDATLYSDGDVIAVCGSSYDAETNSVPVQGGKETVVIYR